MQFQDRGNEEDEGEKEETELSPLHDNTDNLKGFDEALKHFGGHGFFEKRTLLMNFLIKIIPACLTFMPVFITVNRQFICVNEQAAFTSSDQCSFSRNTSEELKNCTKWNFSQTPMTSTLQSQFLLVCDRTHLVEMSTFFYFLGFMFGCTLYGIISDKYGRLHGIYISYANVVVCSFLEALAPYFWMFTTARFLCGFGVGGILTVAFTMTAECADKEHRSAWCFILPNGWTLGIFILVLLAYLERHHQKLQLIVGFLALLDAIALIFLLESTRWLFSTGKLNRALKIARKISRLNGKELPEDFSLQEYKEVFKDARGSVVDLLRTPGLRKVTLAVWFNIFAVALAYYGISLSAGALGGDIFLNTAVIAVVELPARAAGLWFCHKGRRRVLIFFSYLMLAGSLTATAFLFKKPSLHVWLIAAAMIGKFFAVLSFDVMYLYSVEVYPTVVSNVGVGSGSTCARIGAMTAPLVAMLVDVSVPLPFLVQALSSLAASMTVLLLPETLGKIVPETVEQAELSIQASKL